MKKYLILSIAMIAGLFVSCDESVDTQQYSGGDIAYFSEITSTKLVNESNPALKVAMLSTTKSSVDRTYTVNVVELVETVDGAGETVVTEVPLGADNSIALSAATITVPAGEYFGEILFSSDFDYAVEVGQTFVITLSDGSGSVALFNTTHELKIFKQCESDLAGQYSVTTTYGFHDFLPDYSVNTMEVTITEVSAGVYSVVDFSGGLYSVGPYADEYGTGGSPLNALEFSDTCGNISWTGQVDPWGPLVMQTLGTNAVNSSNGVITISWNATAYGEAGVSVYTPL